MHCLPPDEQLQGVSYSPCPSHFHLHRLLSLHTSPALTAWLLQSIWPGSNMASSCRSVSRCSKENLSRPLLVALLYLNRVYSNFGWNGGLPYLRRQAILSAHLSFGVYWNPVSLLSHHSWTLHLERRLVSVSNQNTLPFWLEKEAVSYLRAHWRKPCPL